MALEKRNEGIGPKAKDADFFSGRRCTKFIKKVSWWKSSVSKHIAPRSRSNQCRSSRNLSLRVTRRQTSLAKDGAMMDGGEIARIIQHCSLEERGALCGVAVRSQLSLSGGGKNWTFVDKTGEATKHRMEWCAAASK